MLCDALLKESGSESEVLAKYVIFLPTRRACKTVQEAFLRQSEGKPVLLPRLIPFGGIDGEETETSLILAGESLDIPPAISPMRRKLLLMRLIRKNPEMADLTADKALHLADALCAFLDQSYIEQMPFERLNGIVPDEFAAHWQDILKFLETVTVFWPEILKENGVIDPADRQVRMFKAQADLWRKSPPPYPVIAAGSTGSQPATADFLDAVASMENGRVILPGLDLISKDEDLEGLDASHPQYNMMNLLKKFGITRKDIKPFGFQDATVSQERLRLICDAMRPAQATKNWRETKPFDASVLNGVIRADCPTIRDEALLIAMILRQTLETPAKTAALITPDRTLAERVISEMSRWGVVLDDSAGTPLSKTALGTFLSLVLKAAVDNVSAYSLLACLKHPLATCGKTQGEFRTEVRRLETACLRGKPAGEGFEGLKKAAEGNQEISDFVQSLEPALGEITLKMQDGKKRPPEEWLNLHLSAAEALAKSADKSGAERLWKAEAGEAAVTLFNGLKENADIAEPLSAFEYEGLINSFMSSVPVRLKYGMHRRIDILGSMEARLVRPDVLILGGLNEGCWPQTPSADPWMSRPMRSECGLPPLERKIGLAAHDFAQAFCAQNVVITRSLKDGGTPTVPSRWLRRLDAVLEASKIKWPKSDWVKWAQNFDCPDKFETISPPEPRPPVNTRPRKLSVTRIETWMRDPYSIYARYILDLKPLDEIEEGLTPADIGNLLHKCVEIFCTRHPSLLPDDAEKELGEISEELMRDMNFPVKAAAFYKPRIKRALTWFIERQRERDGFIAQMYCEQKGSVKIKTAGEDFELFGFADRIDILNDGTASVLDYKTGELPKPNVIEAGYAPQLPLEAFMLLNGGFKDVPVPEKISSLEYWRLKGAEDGGKTKSLDNPDNAIERVVKDLKELIEQFDLPETPYRATPNPAFSPKYTDYDHLARTAEWSIVKDDDGEDANESG